MLFLRSPQVVSCFEPLVDLTVFLNRRIDVPLLKRFVNQRVEETKTRRRETLRWDHIFGGRQSMAHAFQRLHVFQRVPFNCEHSWYWESPRFRFLVLNKNHYPLAMRRSHRQICTVGPTREIKCPAVAGGLNVWSLKYFGWFFCWNSCMSRPGKMM